MVDFLVHGINLDVEKILAQDTIWFHEVSFETLKVKVDDLSWENSQLRNHTLSLENKLA